MLKYFFTIAATALFSFFNFEASWEANAQDAVPAYEQMWLGSDQAKVAIVEYASFTCPHCGTFHERVFGKLKENYIDTGKVKFELREVYFDRPGLWAGILARCGGSEKYFGIVDLLFKRQQQWSRKESALDIVAELMRIGIVAGIERTEIEACFQDQDNAEMLYSAYQEFANSDGITSTPSFVINGELHGNIPYEEFSRIIDELLLD